MDTLLFSSAAPVQKAAEDMTDKEMKIATYKMLSDVHAFISGMKSNYDQIVESIDIDSNTLMQLTGMSKSTISRWRRNKKLRFYVKEDGSCHCKYTDLYIDVKSGRLDGKGFCRVDTLQRLQAYERGKMKEHFGLVNFDD